MKSSSLVLMALLPISILGCSHHAQKPVPVAEPKVVSPVEFADISQSAGLNYAWTVTGRRPLSILQTIGNGCALFDYNNDGNLDILLVGTNIGLFKGDGKGHFTDVSRSMGVAGLHETYLGVACGDIDHDGYDDVYLSGYHCGSLLHNNHGSSFSDITKSSGIATQPWGTSCAFVETSPGSGILDLIVANYVDFGSDAAKYPQLCSAHDKMTACGPRYYTALKPTFYHNDGKGHFRDDSKANGIAGTSNGKGLGIVAISLSDDMKPSLAIANDETAGDLFKPVGKKAYTNVGVETGFAYDRDGNAHAGMGVDVADYDNDGRFDLVVATYQGEAKSLYHNDGVVFTDQSYMTGLASSTQAHLSFGVKFVDFDNDGWRDVIFANGHVEDNVHEIEPSSAYRQQCQLLLNRGGTSFQDVTAASGAAFQLPIVGRGLASGDLDNDGNMDCLIVDSEGRPLLLHNLGKESHHWVSLALTGDKSNRDGYGAVITVTSAGRQLSALCHADGSYLSSSDKRVHFGLGDNDAPVSIKIRWPSGLSQSFTSLGVDHEYRITEGRNQLDRRP